MPSGESCGRCICRHPSTADRDRAGPGTRADRFPHVKAYSPDLANGTGLFAVGTPVQATLHLTNDGPITDITTTVTGWFGASTSA